MSSDPLQRWRDWDIPWSRKPKLIRETGKGRTNRNYLIEIEKKLYMLRLNAMNSCALGIDRAREKTVLEQVSEAGLSAPLLYCSPDHGVMISEFIEGEHWQVADLKDKEKLSLLMKTLADIHALEPALPAFNYAQHADRYWQTIIESDITVSDDIHHQRAKVATLMTEIPGINCLCHHDPNPENIIDHAGILYFLDWEYAAPGWPAFDFAALSFEWNIDIDRLSQACSINTEELLLARELYRYLCELWFLIQSRQNN